EGVADPVRGNVPQGQNQLSAYTRVGVGGQRKEGVQMLQGERGLLGGGILVLNPAVFAVVAAEHPYGLLTEAGGLVLQGRQRGPVARDRVQDPEGAGALVRLAGGEQVHERRLDRLPVRLRPLDQRPPRRVLRGDDRR